MDISKILFDFLKTDNVSSSFEDLDINGDGRINNADKSAAQNSKIANEIRSLLNSVDPETEIAGDSADNFFSSYSQVSEKNLQNELQRISDEIDDKQDEYQKLAEKIEEKQDEYEELMENLEAAQDGDDVSSLKSRTEALAAEIRLLGINMTNLVSNINTLQSRYSNNSKLLETQQNVRKAGSAAADNEIARTSTATADETSSISDTLAADAATSTSQTPATSQTSDCSDEALYVEGKGVNIGKIADVVMDMYDKVKYDKTINQQYEAKYSRFSRNNYTRMTFAIHYLLTSGTDEQKNALKSIFPKNDLNSEEKIDRMANRLRALFGSKKYSKENFVTKVSAKDKDRDGYLSGTETDGVYFLEQHNFKYLTSDGTIGDAELKDDSDNAYGGEIITPENSLARAKSLSLTTINGIETYNVSLGDVASSGKANIHISKSEAEKLAAYFDEAGDRATLDGALEAISGGKVNKSSKTQGSKNEIGRTVTHTTYRFNSESGLSSEIKVSENNQSECKMLAILKALSLSIKGLNDDNFPQYDIRSGELDKLL